MLRFVAEVLNATFVRRFAVWPERKTRPDASKTQKPRPVIEISDVRYIEDIYSIVDMRLIHLTRLLRVVTPPLSVTA